MRSELVIRFEYGQDIPWVRRTERGLHAIAGPNALCLDSPVVFEGRNLRSQASFTVGAGEQVPFVLSWHPSHEQPLSRSMSSRALTDTVAWWQSWCDGIEDVHGEWQELVLRSLMTLKALTYAPTGGIVAAATTSLPGGRRRCSQLGLPLLLAARRHPHTRCPHRGRLP